MALPTLAHRIDGPAGSTAAPLLLLHDLAGDRRLWRPLRPLLSQQRRTISVDLRGHGESPVPPLGDGYDVATHAADLLRLLDALDVDRAVLVGSDLGGAIALEIACNAPERVEALVVSDCTPAPGWPADDRGVQGFEQTLTRRLAAAEAGGMEAVARSVLEHEAEPRVSHDPGPRERVVNRWRMVHADGYIGSAHALLERPDHTADLATLPMPQLWLVGQLSAMSAAISGVAALAPQARIEQVKLAGVGCAWQRRDHWTDYVNAFLADVDAGVVLGGRQPA
ncbi:MAG TPA: alpha/beta fold hydrolase [Dehalococcoidia bacterium]|nr:alpha/beta fold hydrolase [Dehalococcoidia bacterium]